MVFICFSQATPAAEDPIAPTPTRTAPTGEHKDARKASTRRLKMGHGICVTQPSSPKKQGPKDGKRSSGP
ncbi:hypothetical protein ILYODFUR_011785 [Ilyodon furcidens]|uniref:Secreted protein n=1 Tax=Ilyodon furcidens TaxID=33524 RepID=A0ABV0T777_9TELE